jgi:hypothetical protein
MFAMASPALVLFGLFFGAVGVVVGLSPFLAAGLMVPVGLFGIVLEVMRVRWIQRIRTDGIKLEARVTGRERGKLAIWGITPVRLVCVGLGAAAESGGVYRSDWYLRATGSIEALPAEVTVLIDPARAGRFHVDLKPFGVKDSRLNLKLLLLPLALVAIGLIVTTVTTFNVGEGPTGLRKPQASGTVVAAGQNLGHWSLAANGCISGQRKSFSGVSIFNDKNPDQQITLIQDPVAGEVIDADIPGQDKDARFFPRDCPGLKAELRPMGSVVNRVTNLEGRLDAECKTFNDSLSVHVAFQFCH